MAAAVWVGHAEGRIPLRDIAGIDELTGGTLPAAMFSQTMTSALDGVEPVPFHGMAALVGG